MQRFSQQNHRASVSGEAKSRASAYHDHHRDTQQPSEGSVAARRILGIAELLDQEAEDDRDLEILTARERRQDPLPDIPDSIDGSSDRRVEDGENPGAVRPSEGDQEGPGERHKSARSILYRGTDVLEEEADTSEIPDDVILIADEEELVVEHHSIYENQPKTLASLVLTECVLIWPRLLDFDDPVLWVFRFSRGLWTTIIVTLTWMVQVAFVYVTHVTVMSRARQTLDFTMWSNGVTSYFGQHTTNTADSMTSDEDLNIPVSAGGNSTASVEYIRPRTAEETEDFFWNLSLEGRGPMDFDAQNYDFRADPRIIVCSFLLMRPVLILSAVLLVFLTTWPPISEILSQMYFTLFCLPSVLSQKDAVVHHPETPNQYVLLGLRPISRFCVMLTLFGRLISSLLVAALMWKQVILEENDERFFTGVLGVMLISSIPDILYEGLVLSKQKNTVEALKLFNPRYRRGVNAMDIFGDGLIDDLDGESGGEDGKNDASKKNDDATEKENEGEKLNDENDGGSSVGGASGSGLGGIRRSRRPRSRSKSKVAQEQQYSWLEFVKMWSTILVTTICIIGWALYIILGSNILLGFPRMNLPAAQAACDTMMQRALDPWGAGNNPLRLIIPVYPHTMSPLRSGPVDQMENLEGESDVEKQIRLGEYNEDSSEDKKKTKEEGGGSPPKDDRNKGSGKGKGDRDGGRQQERQEEELEGSLLEGVEGGGRGGGSFERSTTTPGAAEADTRKPNIIHQFLEDSRSRGEVSRVSKGRGVKRIVKGGSLLEKRKERLANRLENKSRQEQQSRIQLQRNQEHKGGTITIRRKASAPLLSRSRRFSKSSSKSDSPRAEHDGGSKFVQLKRKDGGSKDVTRSSGLVEETDDSGRNGGYKKTNSEANSAEEINRKDERKVKRKKKPFLSRRGDRVGNG